MHLLAALYWIAYTVCLVLWLAGFAFVGVSGWVFFWAAFVPLLITILIFLLAVPVVGIGSRFK